MIRTIIIDDESINIRLLQNIAERYYPDLTIEATATNVEEGLEAILQKKPELVLLDIELHDKNAFDILKTIDTTSLDVILITAYENYAVEAFKYGVSGYLLKPVQIDEFIQCIDRVKRKRDLRSKQNNPGKDCLHIPTKTYIELIPFKEIMYLESDNTYTYIHMQDARKIVSTRSLKENETELPVNQFIRVHRSFIVNRNFINKYVRSKFGSLMMQDGKEVPISANRKQDVLDLLHLN